jgi:hypothetical protein
MRSSAVSSGSRSNRNILVKKATRCRTLNRLMRRTSERPISPIATDGKRGGLRCTYYLSARAYLAALEADRQAALALCQQKAEEAELIKARQEGFQAAMELLGGDTSAARAASGSDGASSADSRGRDESASDPQEPRRLKQIKERRPAIMLSEFIECRTRPPERSEPQSPTNEPV